MVRTDPSFRVRWKDQQSILDEAMRARLRSKAEQGRVRDDITVSTLMVYLQTFMDGFISRLVQGDTHDLEAVLDIVEHSIRTATSSNLNTTE